MSKSSFQHSDLKQGIYLKTVICCFKHKNTISYEFKIINVIAATKKTHKKDSEREL